MNDNNSSLSLVSDGHPEYQNMLRKYQEDGKPGTITHLGYVYRCVRDNSVLKFIPLGTAKAAIDGAYKSLSIGKD